MILGAINAAYAEVTPVEMKRIRKRLWALYAVVVAIAIVIAVVLPLIEAATISVGSVVLKQAVVTLDPSAMAPGKDAALTGTASVGSRFSINTYAVSGLLCQVYYSHDDKETWALLTTLFGSAGHTQGNEVALEFGLYNTDAKSLRSVMWALQNGDQQAFLQNDCEMDVDVSLWGMVNSPQHIQFFETIGLGGLSLGSDVAMELFFDGLKDVADDKELGEYLAHRMQRYLKNVGHLFEDHLGLHFKVGGFDLGTQVEDLVVQLPELEYSILGNDHTEWAVKLLPFGLQLAQGTTSVGKVDVRTVKCDRLPHAGEPLFESQKKNEDQMLNCSILDVNYFNQLRQHALENGDLEMTVSTKQDHLLARLFGESHHLLAEILPATSSEKATSSESVEAVAVQRVRALLAARVAQEAAFDIMLDKIDETCIKVSYDNLASTIACSTLADGIIKMATEFEMGTPGSDDYFKVTGKVEGKWEPEGPMAMQIESAVAIVSGTESTAVTLRIAASDTADEASITLKAVQADGAELINSNWYLKWVMPEDHSKGDLKMVGYLDIESKTKVDVTSTLSYAADKWDMVLGIVVEAEHYEGLDNTVVLEINKLDAVAYGAYNTTNWDDWSVSVLDSTLHIGDEPTGHMTGEFKWKNVTDSSGYTTGHIKLQQTLLLPPPADSNTRELLVSTDAALTWQDNAVMWEDTVSAVIEFGTDVMEPGAPTKYSGNLSQQYQYQTDAVTGEWNVLASASAGTKELISVDSKLHRKHSNVTGTFVGFERETLVIRTDMRDGSMILGSECDSTDQCTAPLVCKGEEYAVHTCAEATAEDIGELLSKPDIRFSLDFTYGMGDLSVSAIFEALEPVLTLAEATGSGSYTNELLSTDFSVHFTQGKVAVAGVDLADGSGSMDWKSNLDAQEGLLQSFMTVIPTDPEVGIVVFRETIAFSGDREKWFFTVSDTDVESNGTLYGSLTIDSNLAIATTAADGRFSHSLGIAIKKDGEDAMTELIAQKATVNWSINQKGAFVGSMTQQTRFDNGCGCTCPAPPPTQAPADSTQGEEGCPGGVEELCESDFDCGALNIASDLQYDGTQSPHVYTWALNNLDWQQAENFKLEASGTYAGDDVFDAFMVTFADTSALHFPEDGAMVKQAHFGGKLDYIVFEAWNGKALVDVNVMDATSQPKFELSFEEILINNTLLAKMQTTVEVSFERDNCTTVPCPTQPTADGSYDWECEVTYGEDGSVQWSKRTCGERVFGKAIDVKATLTSNASTLDETQSTREGVIAVLLSSDAGQEADTNLAVDMLQWANEEGDVMGAKVDVKNNDQVLLRLRAFSAMTGIFKVSDAGTGGGNSVDTDHTDITAGGVNGAGSLRVGTAMLWALLLAFALARL